MESNFFISNCSLGMKGGTQPKLHDKKVQQERPKVKSEEQQETKPGSEETTNVAYKNYTTTKAREGRRAE